MEHIETNKVKIKP